MSTIAFFDFDGTICPKDSFIAFIKYTDGSLKLFLCALLYSPLIVLVVLGLYSRDKLKEKVFSFFYENKSVSELEAKGDEFGTEVLPGLCYDSALEVIRWHLNKGHQIYLLTASSDIWLKKWCDGNDVKLIGTVFESIDSKYTGKILGKNCRGEEKLRRIDSFLGGNKTYGYGDSRADKFFLDAVDHGYLGKLDAKSIANILDERD